MVVYLAKKQMFASDPCNDFGGGGTISVCLYRSPVLEKNEKKWRG